jgi:hypothetical protein
LERCVPVNLRDLDIEVAVLACEDLILHKLLAGRAIDLADVVALLRLNRSTLDFAYLAHWGGDLRVAPGLAQTWETAWPGEALPN